MNTENKPSQGVCYIPLYYILTEGSTSTYPDKPDGILD